jgi:hypothetical protein
MVFQTDPYLKVNRLGIASREVWCLVGGGGLGIYMNINIFIVKYILMFIYDFNEYLGPK